MNLAALAGLGILALVAASTSYPPDPLPDPNPPESAISPRIGAESLKSSSPKAAQRTGDPSRVLVVPANPKPTRSDYEPAPVAFPPPPPSYEERFARAVLAELAAPYSENAEAFLVGWQRSEGCGGHNPLCRLRPDRSRYSYRSLEAGARIVAAQLDPNSPHRGEGFRASYPRILEALFLADFYDSGADLARAVAGELRIWCGPIEACGDSSANPYPNRVARRASEYDQ